jgi:hypothetical protein
VRKFCGGNGLMMKPITIKTDTSEIFELRLQADVFGLMPLMHLCAFVKSWKLARPLCCHPICLAFLNVSELVSELLGSLKMMDEIGSCSVWFCPVSVFFGNACHIGIVCGVGLNRQFVCCILKNTMILHQCSEKLQRHTHSVSQL